MEFGVDGFRFDAVLHIFEDEQLRDEPRVRQGMLHNTFAFFTLPPSFQATDGVTDDPDDYYYLDHIYTLGTCHEIFRHLISQVQFA